MAWLGYHSSIRCQRARGRSCAHGLTKPNDSDLRYAHPAPFIAPLARTGPNPTYLCSCAHGSGRIPSSFSLSLSLLHVSFRSIRPSLPLAHIRTMLSFRFWRHPWTVDSGVWLSRWLEGKEGRKEGRKDTSRLCMYICIPMHQPRSPCLKLDHSTLPSSAACCNVIRTRSPSPSHSLSCSLSYHRSLWSLQLVNSLISQVRVRP